MGREIKRVALNFDWPLDKAWEGFLNPHYTAIACEHCKGKGDSPAARSLTDMWYGYVPFRPEDNDSTPFLPDNPYVQALAKRNTESSFGYGAYSVQREAERLCELFNDGWNNHLNQDDVNALVEADRLHDFTHTWTKEKGWEKKNPPYIPTAAEVNQWSIAGFGHDCINQWICVEARLKKQGISGLCEFCKGEGHFWPSEEAHKLYEDWKPTEPPAGTGWQVWETVSEGSPITPVFATKEELVDYLVDGGDGWDRNRGDKGWDRAAAERFCERAWAPSMIMQDGIIYTAGDDIPDDEINE